MTQEDEKYYDDYFDLFNTSGWSQLMSQVKVDAETFKVESMENEKHLYHSQGQMLVLNTLLDMEDNVRSAYDSILVNESLDHYES